MPSELEIRLLGPFEVLAAGRPADVGGSKRQALLAMLALHGGRVVGVDALIDGLWGEELPSAPRNALHHHVARLRATLAHESIIGPPDGYALKGANVDALRFEELLEEARAELRQGDPRASAHTIASALSLWRGPALQGLATTTWFSAEAGRLEALRVDALEEQFQAALELGEHREAVSALRAAVAESPFRERLWGQLMLALYRSGRQADALDTFQEARRVLAEELGLEPGPELRRLQEGILAHDPAIAAVAAAPRRTGKLPASSTSFVGREAELAQVVELLRRYRLVTLTGPPGVGKSRLALETARSLEPDTPGGIWMVELARAADAADTVRLLADAVDVRGADPLAAVASQLRDAEAIVVLDACEHVLEEAARVASALLAGCPNVRVLATSREVLHLTAEARVRLEPLPLAGPGAAGNIESPAAHLFLERARAARPGFNPSDEDERLMAEITRRLEGLPLAIELAAARANVLGLAELLSVVDRRPASLGDPSRCDPTRTALERLVEWSYDLLHGDEKTLLHALAVHRGGASLASLVAVGARHGLDEPTVTYLLGVLVDKSIVSVSFPAGSSRYDLLDTIREYVLERLTDSGNLASTREAHAEYYATLAARARTELRGPEWLAWEQRLELENDNFWSALAYARDASDAALATRLGALGLYFVLGERISEGRRFLELVRGAAADAGPLELRIELLAVLCYLATEELDHDAAIEAGERALTLAAGAPAKQAGLAQLTLALAAAQFGEEERAAALLQAASTALEAAGDNWGSATGCIFRATAAARAGDAATVAEMASAIHRHSEAIRYDAFRVPAMLLEAWVAERRMDHQSVEETYRRALELAGRIGFADHAAFALSGLGANALARGDPSQAQELQRQAIAASEAAQAAWTAAHARVELARALAAAGDVDTAEELYRGVAHWSDAQRPRQGRESLFDALAGRPAAAALLGLATIAEARGDATAAAELRARAGLIPT